MPRFDYFQPSFNAGELSPRLAGRIDFDKYPAGLETCENIIPLPEGGAMRRPGSRYVATVKSSAVKGRLKSFEFNVIQAYVLEMGDGIIRFYRYQAQIAVADTDAAVSNGTFPSGITDWDDVSTGAGSIAHDATNLDLDLVPGGAGATDIGIAEQDITTTNTDQEHVIKFRVVGDPGDLIEFQVGTSSGGTEILAAVEKEVGYHCVAFTPTASPFYVQFRNLGSNANKTISIDDVSLIDNDGVEIDAPWAEADLYNVEGPQSADILYLFHDSYPTHKLERFGHTTWSLVEIQWQDGPYLDQNTTATTLTPSATTGLGITITASATTGINDGDGFASTDVGRLIRISNPASGTAFGWGIIVGYTSSTVVTLDVQSDFSTTNAATVWHLGAWSETTGYPQAAVFFEQRLYVGATTDQPQTFWASQTADFENFKPDDDTGTVEADDALSFTLSADNVNAIRWLSANEDALVIGTAGGEWVPTSTGIVITPLDITVKRQTTYGSARIQPVRVGNSVIFVQRANRKIREFALFTQSDQTNTSSYRAIDVTRLAQHITIGGIVEMDYVAEPDPTLWAVRGDGQLLSLTLVRDEDVVGWGRHILGGSFDSGDAVAESLTVIPGANGGGQVQDSSDRSEVWVLVKRTINGSTVRYIEVFEGAFETGDAQEDAYYVDSLLTYDGAAATAFSGFDHLEGETIKVLGDGAIIADQTVTSGTFTLSDSISVLQGGLGFTHTLKTLKIPTGNPAGTPVGKKKRIYGLTFVLLNSHTVNYGPDTDNLTEKDFRVVSDAMDNPAPLFTGEKFVEFPGDWDTDARIVIQSDDPVPFSLLAMAPNIQINPLK